MDFQHRPGGKTGSGGVASSSESNRDRRERLRQLALETIDINKDPYFMKNHLGSYECKLCLTLHNNEGSYLAHTQGKKHQTNLARRAAKEAKEAPAQPAPEKVKVEVKKFVKIGRPGYKGEGCGGPPRHQPWARRGRGAGRGVLGRPLSWGLGGGAPGSLPGGRVARAAGTGRPCLSPGPVLQ